jgi:hypothetical protein
MAYTTRAIDSALNDSSRKNDAKAIIVMNNDIDKNVSKNKTYNISSQGINFDIKNFYDFINYTDRSVSLKTGLFTLSIGNELTVDSSVFRFTSDNPQKDFQKGTLVSEKLATGDEAAGTLAATSYNYEMKMMYVVQGDGTLSLSIRISITLYSDITGSLPTVKIHQAKPEDTLGTYETGIEPVGKIVDYSYAPNTEKNGKYNPTALNMDTIYKPSGDYEKVGTKDAKNNNQYSIDSHYTNNSNDIEGFFTNMNVGNRDSKQNPNMNVRVILLYTQKLKTLKSSGAVHSEQVDYMFVGNDGKTLPSTA